MRKVKNQWSQHSSHEVSKRKIVKLNPKKLKRGKNKDQKLNKKQPYKKIKKAKGCFLERPTKINQPPPRPRKKAKNGNKNGHQLQYLQTLKHEEILTLYPQNWNNKLNRFSEKHNSAKVSENLKSPLFTRETEYSLVFFHRAIY